MKRSRWEYLVVGEEKELAPLGDDGWELVSVVVANGREQRYFKRPALSLSEELTLSQRDAVLKEREHE